MLYEHAEFGDRDSITKVLDDDHVFRYCEFSSASIEGRHIDGTFIGCTFSDIDWYWGLFNCCVFVRTGFAKCVFRGSSFPDCRFIDCEFVACQFLEDNLGTGCSADGARVYGSIAKECEGEALLLANLEV